MYTKGQNYPDLSTNRKRFYNTGAASEKVFIYPDSYGLALQHHINHPQPILSAIQWLARPRDQKTARPQAFLFITLGLP